MAAAILLTILLINRLDNQRNKTTKTDLNNEVASSVTADQDQTSIEALQLSVIG